MTWVNFPFFSITASLITFLGIIFLIIGKKKKIFTFCGHGALILGIGILCTYVILYWIHLERPPLRTLGETRLWYSLFMILIGYLIYLRWKYMTMLIFSALISNTFIVINLMHPETYEKTLMPALQSPWFAPHVMVYILSYAMLGLASIIASYTLIRYWFKPNYHSETISVANNMVYIGFSFLTMGLIFGAMWAKEAWGHYWTWDPKETWAFLTWIGYLIYIHFRYFRPQKIKTSLWTLSLAFLILLICWFGVNYLPSAQTSVHIYSQ